MIVVFGSINMDLVARVPQIARPGETVLSPRSTSFFGGKGANQAVAAARAGRGGPVDVAMAGAVGDDGFGKACLDNLRANGVHVAGVRIVDEPTGLAFIAVDEAGENAITVASGANAAIRAHDLPEMILSAASVLVLQMEVPLAESLTVARRARQAGATVIWNFAPAPADATPAHLRGLLEATSMLVVNEHEAVAAASLLGHEVGNDPLEAGAALAREHDVTCIVTAGSRGAFAIGSGGRRIHAHARPITPIDTTGAGDTFVGVLANGIAEGMALDDALQRACLAASLSCLTAGAQEGMPFREAIDHGLASP